MASPSVLSRRDGSGVKQFVFTVWTFEQYRPPHSYMRHILSLIGAIYLGFPGDSDGKESACNARVLSMIPGSERSSGEWNGHPLQYSCLESERESEVAQSCPTLCDPMDCSLPGSPTHGIFQARVLEWVAISEYHLVSTEHLLNWLKGQTPVRRWWSKENDTGPIKY